MGAGEGATEKAGERLDEAVSKVGEKLEDTTGKVADKLAEKVVDLAGDAPTGQDS